MAELETCPICGAPLTYRGHKSEGTPSAYGTRYAMGLFCEDEACGFEVAFPFRKEVYYAYTVEELQRRSRLHPPDTRARMLRTAIRNAKEEGDSPEAEVYRDALDALFADSLEEILKGGRVLHRALSHRETDPAVRERTREKLIYFMRFLEYMEGLYPSEEVEETFEELKREMEALDCYYELGMLMLHSDREAAETFFQKGAEHGGMRSRVAYVKYILAESAETTEELNAVTHAFLELSAYSFEALTVYLSRAEVGRDSMYEAFRAYAERTYPTLSLSGQLSFLRLALSTFLQTYEPALTSLYLLERTDGREKYEGILLEMTSLVHLISDLVDELSSSHAEEGVDRIAADNVIAEEKDLLEYAIGAVMYYYANADFARRFDVGYLREAIGHLACFLLSPLFVGEESSDFDMISTAGFANLRMVHGRAREYRKRLVEWIGPEEGMHELL